ncbi:MAG: 50S ribosomal protein L13 [Patescibacteria group bacterium]
MKTYQPKAGEVKRGWHLIDAKGQVLGRLSTKIASLLMGKGKVTFSEHMDSGDNVVVTGASEIKVTGRKEKQKTYISHSGYPRGLKVVSYSKMKAERPENIIKIAVSGMLQDNRLKAKRLARLHIFAGESHSFKERFQNGKEN